MPGRFVNKIDSHIGIIILMIGFGILYFLLLFLNHFNFSTSIYDLGINTNALFDYSRFKWNDSILLKSIPQNLLGEHFDLYLILLSPFSYLLKSFTLPVVQVIAICFGGLGIYSYFLETTSSKRFANAASLYFFTFFGIFSGLLYSYESYAVATMIIPWFFYYFHRERFTTAYLLFILILISRETSSLWMSAICLGMIVNYHTTWRLAKKLLEMAFIAFLYYLMVTELIMPAFSVVEQNVQFEYSSVGETYLKSIGWIIKHPVLVTKMLLFNHIGIEGYDYTKVIFIVFGIFSGGIFLIFRPQYIFMLIPVYFSKLLSDHVDLWGIDGHYCIEMAPLFTIGIFSYFSGLWQVKLRRTLVIITLAVSIILSVSFITENSGKNNERKIFNSSHLTEISNSFQLQKAISKIPNDIPVSAEFKYIPNLAYRNDIYVFPEIKNASYIVLSKQRHIQDANTPDPYYIAAKEIINSRNWTIDYQNDNFYILRRTDL